ncbi:AAA family ATPase [Fusobacterium perfoetens]|uniref:AAA family ATPase n=1 Tax=Fusobacterium perfoetens TaxID=852 RepID=UPI001F2AC3F3|nr:AAA family ATPase [Fusobacterium perfoetens]MCF2612957.1 AAA family ATPase [Fusobacterium perfoetens]
MKKIPIGIEDFKELISDNYFYIDKTKFIEEIFNDGAKVKLFTRPRRFGKTLNMSMLKTFFDIKEAEENRQLFDSLYIKNSPVFKEQGKYPVVFVSMKEIKGTTWEEMQKSIRENLSNLYEKYSYLKNSLNERNKRKFEKIWFEEINGSYSGALSFLSEILEEQYNEKVIVLIDEYDVPLTMAYEYGFYDIAVIFFKSLYGSVLKTNSSLKMGVLTGAIRVAQAGIFSDLNNIETHTILDEAYDEYFGLLENEVENALLEYKSEDRLEDVKLWYDGYKFGNIEVYNPWSILKYIKYKKLEAYWINTSGNVLIKELLLISDGIVFEDLDNLVNGHEKTIYVNENVALGNNLDPNRLWELMLFSGYLTVKEKINSEAYLVKIPNKEIQSFFKSLFAEIVFKGKSNIASMKGALESKDINTIVNILEKVVLNAISFYDTNKKFENPYQTLLAGFFYALDDYYRMIPNPETGYGRADIVLIPKNKKWSGYVFELKRAKTKNLEKEAEKALEQIEEKKYETILINEKIKEIIKIGLVFDGKKAVAYY